MVEYGNRCKKYLTYAFGLERNIRPSVTRLWSVTRQGSLPPNWRVPSERILLSELQNMTDIIMVYRLNSISLIKRKFYKKIISNTKFIHLNTLVFNKS
jgi:hypothetical protein